MRIGIVSDTHGKDKRLRAALEALVARGAEAVVHCGDTGSADCLTALAGCGVPAYLVAGNMDRRDLDRIAEATRAGGVTYSPRSVEVPLGDGRHLAATHGHDEALLEELITGGQFAYVCHGHTHRKRFERIGEAWVINPGALRHPRGGGRTAALLDTDADTLDFLSAS